MATVSTVFLYTDDLYKTIDFWRTIFGDKYVPSSSVQLGLTKLIISYDQEHQRRSLIKLTITVDNLSRVRQAIINYYGDEQNILTKGSVTSFEAVDPGGNYFLVEKQ
jgi:hypothetical protein